MSTRLIVKGIELERETGRSRVHFAVWTRPNEDNEHEIIAAPLTITLSEKTKEKFEEAFKYLESELNGTYGLRTPVDLDDDLGDDDELDYEEEIEDGAIGDDREEL